MPESETKKLAAREPRALSTEYHKAHKQLMLWATILFIWELVGVDLGKAKDAGGNVGPVVTALKSPQAVPWVLLILVLYFLFKCSIEWAQCHPERRKVRFARIDFISAWIVSVAAISLYIGQAVSRVQFADRLRFLGSAEGFGLLAVAEVFIIQRGAIALRRARHRGRRPSWMTITHVGFGLFSLMLAFALLVAGRLPGMLMIIFIVIATFLGLADYLRFPVPVSWLKTRKRPNPQA
jgi:hypothetical protein